MRDCIHVQQRSRRVARPLSGQTCTAIASHRWILDPNHARFPLLHLHSPASSPSYSALDVLSSSHDCSVNITGAKHRRNPSLRLYGWRGSRIREDGSRGAEQPWITNFRRAGNAGSALFRHRKIREYQRVWGAGRRDASRGDAPIGGLAVIANIYERNRESL